MPANTSTIEAIKKCLEQDYQATHGEQQHLIRYIQGNLHELRQALENHLEQKDWPHIVYLGEKIEALAINLGWDELRQAGSLIEHVTEQQDVATLERLIRKLDRILGATFA